MDLNPALGGFLPQFPGVMAGDTNVTGNDTSAPYNNENYNIHNDLIAGMLPLVGLRGILPLYQFLASWIGWDPTVLLTMLGVVWTAIKVFKQLYTLLEDLIEGHLMSSIHLRSGDSIYEDMLTWLSRRPGMINSRDLLAKTADTTAEFLDDPDDFADDRDCFESYLNCSDDDLMMKPPQYTPARGSHTFWWKGRYFRLERKPTWVSTSGSSSYQEEELIISCLWRNPTPIKELVEHTKKQALRGHEVRTIISRPSRNSRGRWRTAATRPVRDIQTVVLDAEQKRQVLADMNEYLHPATPRWYANRGIPLRRGYLFYGPPGTGKSSLSFALAGVFSLDIYVVSLLGQTLTEEDLSCLFDSLPRRCVILLEDIDAAGLRRRPAEFKTAEDMEKKSLGEEKPKETMNDIKELAKVLREDNGRNPKSISLSGLLNVIDGVASHEGRILIMTTNAPEMLDDALLRPGRVDLQVQFKYATKQQAEELFVRMYDADQGQPRRANAKSTITKHTSSGKDNRKSNQLSASSQSTAEILKSVRMSSPVSEKLDILLEELPEVARQFSEKIPEGKLSPAEIQGYLLKRKSSPRRAVEEADKWVAALVQQKASGSKIIRVQ